MFEQAHWKN